MSHPHSPTLEPSSKDGYLSPSASAFAQDIEQDIRQLCHDIDSTNALFDRVSRLLRAVEYKYLKAADTSGALMPHWVSCRKRFNQYVDRSRESAAAVSAVMDLYANAVLGKVKEVDCNVETLVKGIRIFRGIIAQRLVTASSIRDGFRSIVLDMKDIKCRLVERYHAEVRSQSMSDTIELFRALGMKVTWLSNESTDGGASVTGMVAQSAAGAVDISRTIAPKTEFQALKSMFGAPEQEQLAKANASPGIVSQRVEAIWHSLRVDMVSLETDLLLFPRGEKIASNQFLMRKIEASITACHLAVKGLNLYTHQTTVRQAGAPQV